MKFEEKPKVKSVLDNPSLDDEQRIKTIMQDPVLCQEIDMKLKNRRGGIGMLDSNRVKVTFVYRQKKNRKSSGRMDGFEETVPIVEKEGVEEIISEISPVRNIIKAKENEFEVELKDQMSAQMVKFAFDGLELEDLELKLVVSQIKEEQKAPKETISMRKNSDMGASTGQKKFHLQNRKLSYRNSRSEHSNGVFFNKMYMGQQYGFMPMEMMARDMRGFQMPNFPAKMMQGGKFSGEEMNYMQMNYNMVNMHYMGAQQGNGSIKKGKHASLKTIQRPRRDLPPGIVLVSGGKNKLNTNKFTCRYNVMIENDKHFQVAKKIIGSKGCNMKSIIEEIFNKFSRVYGSKLKQTDALKLRLRGKGSGFKEGPDQRESEEPLHLCISVKFDAIYQEACRLVENLLNKIYDDYLGYLRKSQSKHDRAKLEKAKSFRFQKYEGNAHVFKQGA